jgi:nitrogen fixation NifU-like protein
MSTADTERPGWRYEMLLSEEDQRILGPLQPETIGQEVLRHAASPRNERRLANPDGTARLTGICEDTVSIQLCLHGMLVDEIGFQTDGCGFTRACASVATEMVRGRNVGHALELSGQQIGNALGGLPPDHVHCADLAANAVKAAAADALERKSDLRRAAECRR